MELEFAVGLSGMSDVHNDRGGGFLSHTHTHPPLTHTHTHTHPSHTHTHPPHTHTHTSTPHTPYQEPDQHAGGSGRLTPKEEAFLSPSIEGMGSYEGFGAEVFTPVMWWERLLVPPGIGRQPL